MKNQRFLVICDYIDFEKTYTRKSLLTLIYRFRPSKNIPLSRCEVFEEII